MAHTPYIIGVTGGIGSGKSVVAALLQLMEVPVYDCDSRAKQLMDESGALREALVEAVGAKVYGADGKLDRRYLASYMFGDAERVATVNAIVHPAVRADFRLWAQQSGRAVVAVESAILYEAGMEADVDAVWLVHATQEVRLQRAVQRDASNAEAIRKRMQSQLSEQEYLSRADKVVRNDGHHSLIEQVWGLLREILAIGC